jgi:hypothetical protein
VFKRILLFSAIAAVICAGIAIAQDQSPVTSERHKSKNIACTGCHGEEQPKAAGNAEKSCVTCHKSLEAVAEKTKEMLPNPHQNHMTESQDVECTQCHHGHKADTPICTQCHSGFTFAKPQPQN